MKKVYELDYEQEIELTLMLRPKALKKKVKRLKAQLAQKDAEIAELKAPLQWRPFSEEAPKEGQEILVHYSWGPKETYHKVFVESLRDSYISNNNCWIPYPERPEVTE